MTPDLIKTTELFLVPSSFLVAALGTADTNLHRAGVSLLELIVSVLWLWCSREALRELAAANPELLPTTRTRVLAWFSIVFIAGWLFSLVSHLLMANQQSATA